MADVFISYARNDREVAEALADYLSERGFRVWWDFELYAGDNFHDVIRDELERANAVVVIWSDAAAASYWVRGEAHEAVRHGSLVSTATKGFDPTRIPIPFLGFHCEPIDNRKRIVAAIERKGARSGVDSSVEAGETLLRELKRLKKKNPPKGLRKPIQKDITQWRLDQIATRLATLLAVDPDPEEAMERANRRLVREDLTTWTRPNRMPPMEFVDNLLASSPVVWDHVAATSLPNLDAVESSDELVTWLIPSIRD